jgi:hypothetical protein
MPLFSWKSWPQLARHLDGFVDLDASSRDFGLLRRVRRIDSAADMLRLAFAYGPGGLSLPETAAWAELHGIAALSAPALLYQLRNAGVWQ